MKIESILNHIPDEGLYPPHSVVWRVNRDAAILLGGLRALILQIAHPLVAQGVADHSHFQKDPIGRLRRTLDVVLSLAFGDRQTIGQALTYLNKVHQPVRGQLARDVGPYTASHVYSADDHDLRFWVFATLIESSLTMYEKLLKPLSADEKAQYYQENLQIAELLNLSRDRIPEQYDDFDRYFRAMLHGNQIVINETGRKLAEDIFHPRIRLIPKMMHWPVKCFTVGLLPPAIRLKFDFPWSRWHQLIFLSMLIPLKLSLRVLPVAIRTLPAAKRSEKRWKTIASG